MIEGGRKQGGSWEQSPQQIAIRALEAGQDTSVFRTLNEEWITRYFTLEAKDREMLGDPEAAILRKGGRIFLVDVDGATVGCVALVPMQDGVYEVSKMAVAPEMRGLGIGRRLLAYAMEQARVMGATALFLASSTKLENAVRLYETMGFCHIPPEQAPLNVYVRGNVFMKMML